MKVNIPNLLCYFRMACVPGLAALAWTGHRPAFLVLLGLSLTSDALDGWIARALKQESQFGARLDSLADLSTYMTVPILALFLWPDVIRREAPLVIAIFLSCVLPVVLGYLKFGRLPAYHTYGAKLSAVLTGIAAVLLLGWDIRWPIYTAAPILFAASFEEMAITAVLPRWQPNIRSLLHAVRLAREQGHPIGRRDPA
ncbi:MAG: CDP-alcohol phosphatidyltransferase family protein [Lentisphaerae bacterium]|nr:CDP-alcohol phosphatidyltransferase family protein [Lentisphaerota bacterium]